MFSLYRQCLTSRAAGAAVRQPGAVGTSRYLQPCGAGPEFVRGQRAFSRLPLVPNTDHLNPSEVAASSFFALHRPLSIKNSIPQTHTQSTFSSIFDSLVEPTSASLEVKSKVASPFVTYIPLHRSRGGNVERTSMAKQNFLTSSALANPTGTQTQGNASEDIFSSSTGTMEQAGGVGANSTPLEILAKLLPPLPGSNSHLPFHPPPPPVPQTAAEIAQVAAGGMENIRPQKHLVTFQQTTYPNGMIMITTRTKVIAPITSPYMQRVRDKQQEQMESWHRRVIEEAEKAGVMSEPDADAAKQEDMMAISVKRQRKLKMKKHKYKKLMKKTRNLRRRLEKQ
ncbi:hypothetical protein DFH27DRAFT_533527 [Peziza echinospora]|nr:hypothetical protein DFH27DRAFT_533527 [Peziza echinospora]